MLSHSHIVIFPKVKIKIIETNNKLDNILNLFLMKTNYLFNNPDIFYQIKERKILI
jgi:hypothetical protein